MKDNRLEEEFDEYFKGVNISDDITADAKKFVTPKRKIMPKFVKFASIAASIVLVFAVSLTVILKTDFNNASPGNDSSVGDNSPSAPDNNLAGNGSHGGDSDSSANDGESSSSGDAVRFRFYSDSDLTQRDENAYSLSSIDSSLKLIENFAFADNASVESCTGGYNKDNKLVLVRAKINVLSGLNRDETTVFIEFTDKNLIYEELADYYEGNIRRYAGAEYYLTRTIAENGEPEFKLHILYKGVKYYFNVQSSDERAYEKYLQLVTRK